ncbi:Hypothetical protein NocV09_05300280 [Nannochloropsis oceanica]
MRAALHLLFPLFLLLVSPTTNLAAERDLFTSDKDRKANDSALPSKAQIRASKRGCVLKFYPLKPKTPWPTTASPDQTYRLAFKLINRSKKAGSDFKSVWLGIQKPPGANFTGSFRARPALPDATFFPNFPNQFVPLFLWGPFDVPPRRKQYIDFEYTLPVCSPGIAWNITVNLSPTINTGFQRVPPFTGACGTGYSYRRQYYSKRNIPCT